MDMINAILIEVLGSIAENERLKIRRRQREGIDAGLKKNVRFGRPAIATPENWNTVVKQIDAKEITVAQIVEALEGTYDLEDEVDRNSVGRGDQEAIQHLIIDRINDCVQEILEDVTLKDLVDAYEGYQDSVEGMYYI